MNTEEPLHLDAETHLADSLSARCDADKVVHELQVHQIELETQNENLRQTQLALEESRDRYRDLYEFAPVAYVTLDSSGMIAEINHTAAALFGEVRKRLLGSYFSGYLAPADRGRWNACLKNVLVHNLQQRCELGILRSDGLIFPAQLECLRATESGDQAVRIVFSDMSEHHKSQTLLRESEEKFRAIFEGTLDGIVLVDDAGSIVDFNLEFVRQSGMAPGVLRQARIWDLRPDDKRILAREIFLEIIRRGLDQTAELKYKRPDGVVIQVEARGSTIIIGGRRYLQCIVRDITERRLKEIELKKYQRLLRELAAQGAASREAELRQVAREVHDELGQLLTALRMDISLLRIRFGERDPVLMGMVKDMLVLVDKSIQGVRDVTSNLHPPALDMGMVPAIIWLGEEFARRTGIPCRVNIVDDPSGLDDVRTLTLFRIVQESLTNITRYAEAAQVEITVKMRDDNVCVDVRDDGKGFDTKAIPATKSFGLMGMRERALAVSGKVEITSAQGQGTLVCVDIPLFQTNPGRRIDD